jgi:hypothetical protein
MKQSAISNNLSTEVIGTKKLIYYTVYGEWYIKLLEKSIESLIETSIASFDILIISDGESQKKIKNLNVMQNNTLNVFYHTVNVPVDGIAASMNKTIIYDFELIDNYSHVLFLDCDILALKDVDMIFNLLTESEKFYCVCNPQVNSGGYLGIFHGLDYNKEEVFELEVNQRQRPFNAGQFAFLNTARMRKHFKNINYFIANWNGPYFFEQVFMNIYFLYANCCNNVLSDSVCLANASVNNTEAKHSSGDILIHFIAPALSGEVKLDYLTQYFDAHKL